MKDIVTEKNEKIDDCLPLGWKRVGSYVNAKTNIDFVCSNGHRISIRCGHFLSGTRCRYCSGYEPLKNEEIDNLLDCGWKRLSPYKNNHTHLILSCPKGHIVKIKWANYQQGKRCGLCFTERNKGENHHSWKSWLTDEIREKRARKTAQYNNWRKAVYKKDGYTCCVCGLVGKNLNAHHLKSFSANKKERYVVENGVTLCKKCHISFHREYGSENNTPYQYLEFRNKHGSNKLD